MSEGKKPAKLEVSRELQASNNTLEIRFTTTEGFGQQPPDVDITNLQQHIDAFMEETSTPLTVNRAQGTPSLEDLQRRLLTLSPTEIATKMKNLNPAPLPARSALLPDPSADQSLWSSHTAWPDMGKLPSLSFGRYNLNGDFMSFLHDFNMVADAYSAPERYRISQFWACLMGDAKDLFESRVELAGLTTWIHVQHLAKRLFVPTDQNLNLNHPKPKP
jgi:hypothetical protein